MSNDKSAKKRGTDGRDINAIRNDVVSRAFRKNIGERALILISQYPYLIIGSIVNVVSDFLVIKAEITNVSELDDETFSVHIDDIEVFYIEEKGRPIPDIRNDAL